MRQDLLVKEVTVTPGNNPAALTADGTGIIIDRLNYQAAIVSLAIGAIAGTPDSASVKAVVYHGDASNLSDAAILTDVAGSNVETAELDTANTNTTKFVDLRGAKRYIRLSFDTTFSGGTTPSILTSSSVALGDKVYGDGWSN